MSAHDSTEQDDPRLSRRGSATLADVALVAGVSKITASRALSNPDIVSPVTRRRVQEAVVKTGYVPNFLAGGLKSNRSRLIACIVPTISSGSAFMVAVQALTEAFTEAGYQVMLAQRGYGGAGEESLVDSVAARRPDGIVLVGMLESATARERLASTGIPIVEAWDMTSKPIDMLVGFSHRKVGNAIARFLHRKGRRNLAMIIADEPRGMARARGLAEAARRLGLANDPVAGVHACMIPVPSRIAHGREGLRSIMQAYPETDAVYCASDQVALGALIEAASQRIAVPERVAIIGFGDLDFAEVTEPPLTTVKVDSIEIGRQAAALLIARINGKAIGQKTVDLGFTLLERGSA